MICDGYTLFCQIDGYEFLYRPMVGNQLLDELEGVLYLKAVHSIVDKQVVLANWDGGSESLPKDIFLEVLKVVTKPTNHEENLYRGAVLAFAYPHLAETSCASCQAWFWNPITGELHRDNQGNPVRREGKTPCRLPMGCPKGTPENPIELTPENRQAFEHYRMTGGAGSPVDELMALNWSILRRAEHDARRLRKAGRDSSVDGYLRRNPPDHGRSKERIVSRPVVHGSHVPPSGTA